MFIYVNYARKNSQTSCGGAEGKTAKMFTYKYHNDQNK